MRLARMNGWSPKDAIAMERRHILEGAKRVARQKALVAELTTKQRHRLACSASGLLVLLQESLEMSRARLADLERKFGDPLTRNSDGAEQGSKKESPASPAPEE